ncbi:MAG TPA: 1-(5-phosphoribosyl)-5-[(5-phosphoribosylamino)methylideneamino] imidazole-4-carboxamide isomerase [Gammaproteobacteria bacterium]|jgi:phosphoribosylformimino-5-aminoimidazole carboxamide ribotide isomerase
MQLIPAIDIRDGRCVRLFQGDYAQETRYDVDPVALASEYADQGAVWIHVVDLTGAARGQPAILPLVEEIQRRSGAAVQFGGGVRNASSLARALDSAQRVVIGSLAATEPDEVNAWLAEYGGDRLTLALDVRLDPEGTPRLSTHGWTRGSGVSLWSAIETFAAHGLKHLLCTDIERDGALSGPNFSLYGECKRRWPGIRLQASGGVRDIADLERLASLGVDAAISGKALLEGHLSIEEIKPFLRSA